MDIIIQATDLQKFDSQVFVGYGTLLNGKKTGTWNYGPVVAKGNNLYEIYHLNAIEWNNDVQVSTSSIEVKSIYQKGTISEYCGGEITQVTSFPLTTIPAATTKTISFYSDIGTKKEVKEVLVYRIDQIQLLPIKVTEYKESDSDNYSSTTFTPLGKISSEELCIDGNTISRRYFSTDSYKWADNLISAAEKYPHHFDNLVIEEKHGKKNITSYSVYYNQLVIVTDLTNKDGTGYKTTTNIEYQSRQMCEIKKVQRFYYKGQRVGITQEYMAYMDRKTLPLTKSYFSFGNRKIDIAELGITDNNEIDDSTVTFLRLKYK